MRKFFFCLIMSCLPVLTIAAQTVLDSIPFELGADSRVYLRCRVNDSDTLRFLLDTGATDMVMNPNAPRSNYTMNFDSEVTNSGATGVNQIRSSSSNRFTVGETTVEGMRFLSIPYPPDFWDGVIGLSFIGRAPMRIDYHRRMIYLYDPEGFQAPKGALRLKVEYEMGVPVVPVRVRVNGCDYQIRVEVDMGSDRILDLNTPFVRAHNLLGSQAPFAISRISSSDANTGELLNVFFDELELDGLVLPRIPGAFSTVTAGVQASDKMDGVFGNNFLQRFNMTLDLQRGFIYLEPNNLLYKPFYDFVFL